MAETTFQPGTEWWRIVCLVVMGAICLVSAGSSLGEGGAGAKVLLLPIGILLIAGAIYHGLFSPFAVTLTAATLGAAGPGDWSLDHTLGLDVSATTGLAITLAGGLTAAALALGTSFRPPPPRADRQQHPGRPPARVDQTRSIDGYSWSPLRMAGPGR